MNAALRLEGPWPLSTPPDQLVYMQRIDFGLELTDGLVHFRLRPDGVLDLAEARWSFAGGTIRTHGELDLAAEAQGLALEIADVDLAALLVLADLEGLTGSGSVVGRIPIVRRGGTVEIRGGRLAASPEGGWIHYGAGGAATGVASQGQGIGVVLAALENFHYDELVATLDGDTSGPVNVAIHIAGANPDYLGGHPIEFNLNVESHLVDLLRNATAVYRLPQEIEKRLQKMAAPPP